MGNSLDMRGLLLYFSGSGNTELACQRIARQVSSIDVDLFDLKTGIPSNIEAYCVVGFATYANFGGPSPLFYSALDTLGNFQGCKAFVFNTYGFISGATLHKMRKAVEKKGCEVFAGHSLKNPESYPPMRSWGLPGDKHPGKTELIRFNQFITDLDLAIQSIIDQRHVEPFISKKRFADYLLPEFPRSIAKLDFGKQFVVKDRCTSCGICQSVCPYGAVAMGQYPEFDHQKCQGCWSCYNHCQEQAIHTWRYTGSHQYNEPSALLLSKIGKIPDQMDGRSCR